jgi:hypothetical protein
MYVTNETTSPSRTITEQQGNHLEIAGHFRATIASLYQNKQNVSHR